MKKPLETREYRGSYMFGFLVILLVGIRGGLLFRNRPGFQVAIFLLSSFTLLYICEPMLRKSQRFSASWLRNTYFPIQAVLILILANLRPILDVTNLLYITLSFQIFHSFPRRSAILWVITIAILQTMTMVLGFGWAQGMVLSLFYLAVLVFMVSYDLSFTQAKAAQAESQMLLAELQEAHQKLIAYMDQSEELAVLRERNRLVSEFHESVSHTIFSINLTARSAQILLTKDPNLVEHQLTQLQEMTQAALAQMRSLIAQLRPKG
jgi:signal transduction histidine kinase